MADEALRAEMIGRFEQVDRRFEQVDRRFEQMDQRFEQMDQRFTALQEQIREEATAVRRHFDMVVREDDRLRRVLADGVVRNRERLDDHERRLGSLEGKTDS